VNQEHTGNYAPVNGLSMYYKIHGAGRPLVLLHGGLDTIGTCFGTVLPALAETRQVVAVELQGHGHTADIDRPLRYEQMADDIAALISYLGFSSADVFGFSVGGGVALQTAIRHPSLVRKLVVASAPYKSEGWFPEILAGIAATTGEEMIGTPWHDAYIRVAPRPEDWPVLVAKVSQLLTGQPHDWSAAVAALTVPTLIVLGDADSVRLEHAVEMFGLLGGGQVDGGMGGLPSSRLAVLPATTHLDMLSRTDLLLPIVTTFLDAPPPSAE
jgi:pimeloyl-ACP methyl ester carboxylesterase